MNCRGLVVGLPRGRTLISIPGAGISYSSIADGVVGMCGTYAGDGSSGNKCSSSEASIGVSSSTSLFSNMATATIISQTVSNNQPISLQDNY